MHAVLTLILIHDRYLSGSAYTPLSTVEAFYWQQGLHLYIRKLLGPLQPSDIDCLWATGATFSVAAFSHIEAKTLQQVWPLKPPSSLDLNWLKMSEGKKEFLKRMQPTAIDNAVGPLFTRENIRALLDETPPILGLDALPFGLITLCCLDVPVSSPEDNPYYLAASSLAQSLNSESKQVIVLNFVGFLMSMPLEFRKLLELKDPRALLLLAWWYARHIQYPHWWLFRRAKKECQAICIYLKSYHWDHTAIQDLLQYPWIMNGIAAR